MYPKKAKLLPYGMTDIKAIIQENYYYVDKSHFIPMLEDMSRFAFLIRPRRFGKSLLIALLESYYDVARKHEFDSIFGDLWIHKNQTTNRNKFLVLRLNFSILDSRLEYIEQSFHTTLGMDFDLFACRYASYYPEGFREGLAALPLAADKLNYLFKESSKAGQKLYLFIDEYDNFSNTILAEYGDKTYEELTHGTGFFRSFFNVLKGGTTGVDSALGRLFITGVSPVTMDDVTSGFNIGMNISAMSMFNEIIGFTEEEVRTFFEYYQSVGLLKHEPQEMIDLIKPWYDNYCFAEKSVGTTTMYNSDMLLFFMTKYIPDSEPPEELIDPNVRTDYNKLRKLIRLDPSFENNANVIQTIVNEGCIVAKLINSFPAEDMAKYDHFVSLLYYYGMLTIKGTDIGDTLFAIPNHVVREQYFGYLQRTYERAYDLRIDNYDMHRLIMRMAYKGEIENYFDFVAKSLAKQSRIREFIEGEAHVKGFMLAYMGMTPAFMMYPEYESGKGYTDFYMAPRYQAYPDMPYSFAIEVKYLKREENREIRLPQVISEASEQLNRYVAGEEIQALKGPTTIRKIVVVFQGWELIANKEV